MLSPKRVAAGEASDRTCFREKKKSIEETSTKLCRNFRIYCDVETVI